MNCRNIRCSAHLRPLGQRFGPQSALEVGLWIGCDWLLELGSKQTVLYCILKVRIRKKELWLRFFLKKLQYLHKRHNRKLDMWHHHILIVSWYDMTNKYFPKRWQSDVRHGWLAEVPVAAGGGTWTAQWWNLWASNPGHDMTVFGPAVSLSLPLFWRTSGDLLYICYDQ